MNMKRFLEFFSDGISLSMSRLMLFFWGTGVLFSWIYVCLKTKSMIDVPQNIVMILGIFVAGKVIQSFSENNSKLIK